MERWKTSPLYIAGVYFECRMLNSFSQSCETLRVVTVAAAESSAYLLSVEFTESSSGLYFCSPSEMEIELI